MIKILTVLGARPQFIKAAALSRVFSTKTEFREVIVHTGQHFDENMSEIFFNELSIPRPAYNLNIHSLSHGAMTGYMMAGIEELIQKEKPDYVLVYGDTNSTLAGALAARKLKTKVIHVEAGLRSFNMDMPEEINRILTDRVSNLLFCPTETAVANLQKEGFLNFDVHIVRCGDVMQDAALFYAQNVDAEQICRSLGVQPGNFALCTLHRAENTDDPNRLASILKALRVISHELPVLMPVHPRTRARLTPAETEGIVCIEPLGYLSMIGLLKSCNIVLTDSGGLQKEAYFFKKHCLTLRTETEWVELVQQGVNKVVGYQSEKILDGFREIRQKTWKADGDLYGAGNASQIIADAIISYHHASQ
jgi:UDP-GlcNAc3NAcA epimerase